MAQTQAPAQPVKNIGTLPIVCSYAVLGLGMIGGVWGLVHMSSDDDSFLAQALTSQEQTVDVVPAGTVTLPDENGDGIPDDYEEDAGGTSGEDTDDHGVHAPSTGKGDEDDSSAAAPVPEPEPEQDPKATTYTIQQGDTLSEISGETGVPLDVLVDTNGVQNPNLIYAGASLIIPPM
jgi:LysM repeat protein